MNKIESISNQRVKHWKKLHNRRHRQKEKSYLIENFHLVEECISNQPELLQTIIIREDTLEQKEIQDLLSKVKDVQTFVITDQIAKEISNTQTNQGLFAQINIKTQEIPEKFEQPILILDAVQDPGNVGTMIRTASAAGYQAVFLGEGTVDLYNDKTLRAAQGSHFQMDIYAGKIEDFIVQLKNDNISILATILDEEALPYKEVEISKPYGLIVGNEGAGIADDIIEMVDKKIYIPMNDKVESLNVAIASSIIMFHLNQ